jgi:hypothetical protein
MDDIVNNIREYNSRIDCEGKIFLTKCNIDGIKHVYPDNVDKKIIKEIRKITIPRVPTTLLMGNYDPSKEHGYVKIYDMTKQKYPGTQYPGNKITKFVTDIPKKILPSWYNVKQTPDKTIIDIDVYNMVQQGGCEQYQLYMYYKTKYCKSQCRLDKAKYKYYKKYLL